MEAYLEELPTFVLIIQCSNIVQCVTEIDSSVCIIDILRRIPMLTGVISVRCNQPSGFFFLFFSCIYLSTISFNMLFTVGPMLLGILPVLISTINKVYKNNNISW